MNTHPPGRVTNRSTRPNAGIDVSKPHPDSRVESTTSRVANDATGWGELTAKLIAADVDLVVIEATGGHERGVVCALQQASLCVARVNPRQSRDFAQSMGALAKTDPRSVRVARQRQGHRAGDDPDHDGDALHELGRLDRRQISKRVGVAPLADDSGKRSGKRRIWGGRADVRAVLYMATQVAIRHNLLTRNFRSRLIAARKPKRVAIVACMRKLLTIVNAMLRDGAMWDATSHLHAPQR